MGFLCQYRATVTHEQPRRILWQFASFLLVGFFALSVVTTLFGQQMSAPENANEPVLLKQCSCGDVQRLQDRLQKLKAVELLITNKLQSTPPGKPATHAEWNSLQSQINGYLRAMEIQGLTTFPDTGLFNGNDDPFCGPQKIPADICRDQEYAVHQTGHDASCRSGNWSWQTTWADTAMLDEEAAAIQKEMESITETLKHLGCGGPPASMVGVPPPQTNQVCPQFMIVVQNVTTTSFNMPGAINERSGRSLNNGQGIPIPLTIHDDGTFEGFGSGTDAGSGMGATSNETVRGQFGHMQAIAASGSIHPGSCTTQPCQPDGMHLVLVGGTSQQITQMQARGVLNRDINQTTPTNAARLEFDLPAYTGNSAQKTFFATAILNSAMTVNLLQANNGTPALPMGSSLLYWLQQCKAVATRTGGGATGIVIPGLEGGAPIPTKKISSTAPSQGAVGVVIPGLEGVPTTPTSRPAPSMQGKNIGVVIPGLETGTTSNVAPAPPARSAPPPPSTPASNLKGVVSESLGLSDVSATPAPHTLVTINESFQVSDAPMPPADHLPVQVNESFHASDALISPTTPVAILVNESIHIADKPASSPGVAINVSEGVHVTDKASTLPSVDVVIYQGVFVTESESPSITSP